MLASIAVSDLLEIAPPIDWRSPRRLIIDLFIRLVRPFLMAGFLPDEGEALVGNMVWKRVLTDRDANLELGLFTNSAPGETITEAAITEPSGTGYSRITLTDANWTGSADVRSYPQQTFTAGGAWTGSVQGYFIATIASGGTKRLLAIEVDGNGPYTFATDDTYKVTPNNTTA